MTNEQLEKLVIGNRNKQLTYGKDNNLGAAYFMLKNYLETQTVFDAKGWFDCFWGRIAEVVNQRKLDSAVSSRISVDDSLPDEMVPVFIFYKATLNLKPRCFMAIAVREGGKWFGLENVFGSYVFDDEYNYDNFNDDLYGYDITHWMPIPPPPNE